MAYPSDVLLPVNARYVGLIDPNFAFNPHWDLVWSFTYALTGTQHAFCTFLTTSSSLISSIPGQYLGYFNGTPSPNGDLAIAFDSTGLFALSTTHCNGVPLSAVKPNSLIIRSGSNLVYNETISAFSLSSLNKEYNTIRVRLTNSGKKLGIDYHFDLEPYQTLTQITLSTIVLSSNPIYYPAITFTSPVSSSSIIPSKFWLKNFHAQGDSSNPTYETMTFTPISSSNLTNYTLLTTISAN